MIGKSVRPSREPLYSEGNREQFPIPPEYERVEYMDFIRSHVKNRDLILISQSLCQNYFCGIFASHKKLSYGRTISWWIAKDYDDIFSVIRQKWEEGQFVYSLVADDTTGIFGAFLIKGYGNGQKIIPYDALNDTGFDSVADLLKLWEEVRYDKRTTDVVALGDITSITSNGSTYYIVITDNAIGYHGRRQTYFTGRHWPDVENQIWISNNNGFNITSICYNEGLQEYLVVMTLSCDRQSWFKSGDASERSYWMSEMSILGYHPSLIFDDQIDDKILVVMTSDSDRSPGHFFRANYQLVW